MFANFAIDMALRHRFSPDAPEPLYRQLAELLTARIRDGEFSAQAPLPSLNAMALLTGLSRETVVAAYRYLQRKGILSSSRGRGYFVREEFLTGRQSVLVLLDKFSPHQQTVLDAFTEALGHQAEVTVLMHYQNPDRFAAFLDHRLGRYDYYLVFPHFPTDAESQGMALEQIRRIPPEKLILMDRLIPWAPETAGASYQSIEEDIPGTLSSAAQDIRSFGTLRFIPLSISLYGSLVGEVIKGFCEEHRIPFEALRDTPEKVRKGDVFFLTGSRLDRKLVSLVSIIRKEGLRVGPDVGIICYNDFPLNELILGGLTTLSTDFSEMGRAAAEMVLSHRLTRTHCHCRLIRRNTF